MTDAPTRRGVHERLAALPVAAAPSYDPRRTMPLRIEFVRQLRRRRTQFAFLILLVLPVIIAIAFKVGGSPASTGGAALVDLASHGGANFALFTEFASVGFLLVVIAALFCGDTVASEATWGSLRYLLAMPVPRARLLRQKLTVAVALSFGANLLLPAWGMAVGEAFFGNAPARSPLGATFDFRETVWRLLVIVAYACGQALVVVSLAFLLSVSVDNPLGAVGGATMLVVVSNILDQIAALDPYRRLLPTHFQFSWLDTLGTRIVWDDMIRGTGSALVYSAVFFGPAWLKFDKKDITS